MHSKSLTLGSNPVFKWVRASYGRVLALGSKRNEIIGNYLQDTSGLVGFNTVFY